MKGFEVGKLVVCVKSHTQSKVLKGQVFILRDIKHSFCKCDDLDLDIGLKINLSPGKSFFVDHCNICNTYGPETKDTTCWFSSRIFKPIDEEEFKQVTFTKIIDNVPAGVN